jgi:anaerobic ribonucleoside-triphosphate reductase activating protein
MIVHGLIDRSAVNGPGSRAVVFLQGCSLQCPGCQNPDTHHRKSGTQMTYGALAEWILSREGVTGVTFSGGEPLEQLDDGLDLVIEILREVHPDFSIGIFTGYTLTELNAGKFRSTWNAKTKIANYKKAEAWAWVKKKIDWAVTGRYNQLQPCNEPMRSSENQNIVHFSARDLKARFPDQALELNISANGMLAQITGFPQGVTCEHATT